MQKFMLLGVWGSYASEGLIGDQCDCGWGLAQGLGLRGGFFVRNGSVAERPSRARHLQEPKATS